MKKRKKNTNLQFTAAMLNLTSGANDVSVESRNLQ